MLLTASVNSGAIGQKAPYIYGIMALDFPVLYIGQTLSWSGAIGRLAQHLSTGTDGNTLRKRVSSVLGYDDVEIGQVEFAAFRLLDRVKFTDRVPDYREAVEALVQYSILNKMEENGLGCLVVSQVTVDIKTSDRLVKIQAAQATEELYQWVCRLLG
ncbi:hypothetical protein ACFYTC_49095 [Actinomadura nitritigenes]|uniref:hypothetical protein n=1 Tax=Actinomadura nitritigenes TaxID=134602 RepID=UPI0036B76BEA